MIFSSPLIPSLQGFPGIGGRRPAGAGWMRSPWMRGVWVPFAVGCQPCSGSWGGMRSSGSDAPKGSCGGPAGPAPGTALRPPRNLRGTPVRWFSAAAVPCAAHPEVALPGGLEVRKRGRDAVPVRRLSVPPDAGPRIAGVPAVGAEWCWRSRFAPLARKAPSTRV